MGISSYDYLKRGKPAPITKAQRQETGRPAMRLKMREIIHRAGWRKLRKRINSRLSLSFTKRVSAINYAMGKVSQ